MKAVQPAVQALCCSQIAYFTHQCNHMHIHLHTYIDPVAIVTNDSYSHRSILMSLRVVLNPVDVRGGLSVSDNKSHIRTLRADCA